MKNKLKVVINTLFYIVGIGIIIYIFYEIGFSEIIDSIRKIKIIPICILFCFTFLSAIIRILKIKILLGNKDIKSVIEVYLFSKIGKELSTIGYLSPLIKKGLRNMKTIHALLFDRFIEIFATISLGFFSSIILIRNTNMLIYLFVLFPIFFSMLILFKINIGENKFKIKILYSIKNKIQKFKNISSKIKSIFPLFVILSYLATIFDFAGAIVVFNSLNIDITLMDISVVWAMSGVVAFITFMNLGPGDYTTLYILKEMSNIAKSVSGTVIIVTRFANLMTSMIIMFVKISLFRSKKVKHLVVMITNKCNSRCVHCNIWKTNNKDKKDLDLKFIEKIPGSINIISLTGGDPMLHKNIKEIIIRLYNKKIKRISISTNGLLPKKIDKLLYELECENKKILNSLSFRFSYDAYGPLNDKIRGIKNSAEKIIESIKVIKKYNIKNIGVTQTCSEKNIKSVIDVYDWAKKEKLKYGFQVAHSSDVFYGKSDNVLPNHNELQKGLNYIIKNDLKSLSPEKWFRAHLHSYYMDFATEKYNRPYLYPCLAGNKYRFISYDGSITPCLLINEKYSNILFNNKDVISGEKIDEIVMKCNHKCWMICTASNEIKNNIFIGVYWILKEWIKILFRRKKYDFRKGVLK